MTTSLSHPWFLGLGRYTLPYVNRRSKRAYYACTPGQRRQQWLHLNGSWFEGMSKRYYHYYRESWRRYCKHKPLETTPSRPIGPVHYNGVYIPSKQPNAQGMEDKGNHSL